MAVIQKKKINSFISVFPTSKPKFVLAVMLDEPKTNEDYIYHYRDGSKIKYRGTPFNTAGWTTVEATGQIVEKIGPILATKYSEINQVMQIKDYISKIDKKLGKTFFSGIAFNSKKKYNSF